MYHTLFSQGKIIIIIIIYSTKDIYTTVMKFSTPRRLCASHVRFTLQENDVIL